MHSAESTCECCEGEPVLDFLALGESGWFVAGEPTHDAVMILAALLSCYAGVMGEA